MAIGPLWYTGVSAVKVKDDPPVTSITSVLAPLAPPSLHLMMLVANSTINLMILPQVIGGEILDRGVVVGVLSDVLVDWVLGTTIAELLEDICFGQACF
jgi:hypothetical protein